MPRRRSAKFTVLGGTISFTYFAVCCCPLRRRETATATAATVLKLALMKLFLPAQKSALVCGRKRTRRPTSRDELRERLFPSVGGDVTAAFPCGGGRAVGRGGRRGIWVRGEGSLTGGVWGGEEGEGCGQGEREVDGRGVGKGRGGGNGRGEREG